MDPPNPVFVLFNQTRVILSTAYIVVYLCICVQEFESRNIHMGKIAVALGFVWFCQLLLTNRHYILTVALIFEMINNLMQLGAVPKILKTKARNSVNVPVAACCFVDATIWFVYAICRRDPVFLVLNGAGIFQGALKYHLYYWVNDQVSDKDWIILSLRRYFRLGISLDDEVIELKKVDI